MLAAAKQRLDNRHKRGDRRRTLGMILWRFKFDKFDTGNLSNRDGMKDCAKLDWQ